MATPTLMTAEQFDVLSQDEERDWELLDGEPIEMASPTYEHNRILMELGFLLLTYLRTRGGSVVQDTEIRFNRNSRLRPDLAVFLGERLEQLNRKKSPLTVVPNLAVEVVSPSESAISLSRRIDIYLEAGVDEVWTIFANSRMIDVYRGRDMHRFRAGETIETPLLPGWSLAVDDLFNLN